MVVEREVVEICEDYIRSLLLIQCNRKTEVEAE